MGRGVVCGGRLDDARQQRRLPRLELLDAQFVAGRAAAEVVDFLAEVGLGGRLDPVGAVAEVDRVEVGRDDLFLGPLVRELIRERRLAQLLEDRAVRLGLERVLDELLLDRRGALHGAFVLDVIDERARDAADVDPAVRLEALVLDRDHRLLDDPRDLFGRHDHPVLLAEHADRVAEVVVQVGALLVLVLRELRQRRQVRGDRHEHAEHERDEAQQQDRAQDRREAQPLQAGLAGRSLIGRSRIGGRYVGAIVIAHQRLRRRALRDAGRIRSRWHGPPIADRPAGGTVGPSRRRESSIGPHAERHRRGRQPAELADAGSARAQAGRATPSTACPQGRSRTSSASRARRAARCA